MNRTIKFRGKCPDNDEWVYGYYIAIAGTYKILSFNSDSPSGATYYEVDPSTVGQFTGLLDSGGKEIYEGDILERYNEQGITMHVNYFGSQFGCIQHWDGVDGEGSWYPLDNYDMNQWEVIGNIHDNPELMEL